MFSKEFNTKFYDIITRLQNLEKETDNIDLSSLDTTKYNEIKETLKSYMKSHEIFVNGFDNLDNDYYEKFRTVSLNLAKNIDDESILNTIRNNDPKNLMGDEYIKNTIKSMFRLVYKEKILENYKYTFSLYVSEQNYQLFKDIDELWSEITRVNNFINEFQTDKNIKLFDNYKSNIEYIHIAINKISKFYCYAFKNYSNSITNFGKIYDELKSLYNREKEIIKLLIETNIDIDTKNANFNL